MRLTDEQLDDLVRDASGETDMAPRNGHVKRAVAELRELRAVLATPWSSAFDRPKTTDDADEPDVYYDSTHYLPDEAIALGAALIRAALAAKEKR